MRQIKCNIYTDNHSDTDFYTIWHLGRLIGKRLLGRVEFMASFEGIFYISTPLKFYVYYAGTPQGDNHIELNAFTCWNIQKEPKHILFRFMEWAKTCICSFFYIFPPYWYDTDSLNHPSSKTRTYLFYIVNIMGADVLATQGARASATMILTMPNWINSHVKG